MPFAAALRSCAVAEEPIPGRQRPGLCDPRRNLPQLGSRARANSRWMRCWKRCLPRSGKATMRRLPMPSSARRMKCGPCAMRFLRVSSIPDKLIAFDLSFRRGDIMAFCDRMKAEMPARFPGSRSAISAISAMAACISISSCQGSVPRHLDEDFERRLRDWVFAMAVGLSTAASAPNMPSAGKTRPITTFIRNRRSRTWPRAERLYLAGRPRHGALRIVLSKSRNGEICSSKR